MVLEERNSCSYGRPAQWGLSSQARFQGSIPPGRKAEQMHYRGFFQSYCSFDFIIAFLDFIQCLQIKRHFIPGLLGALSTPNGVLASEGTSQPPKVCKSLGCFFFFNVLPTTLALLTIIYPKEEFSVISKSLLPLVLDHLPLK